MNINDLKKAARQELDNYNDDVYNFPQQMHMTGDIVKVVTPNLMEESAYCTPAQITAIEIVGKDYCLHHVFKVVFLDDWSRTPVEVSWDRVIALREVADDR